MASASKRKRTDKKATVLDFSKPWKSSDIVFLVENKRFHVHRNVLALWSPVFEAMFTSNFSEKKKGEIRLPGKKASSFKTLLLMIYPPSKEEITLHTWKDILELAHEYQIDSILRKCEDFIDDMMPCEGMDVVSSLILAQKYNLEFLKSKCISCAINYLSFKELKEHELFDEIEPGNYNEMLEGIIFAKEVKQRCAKERAEAIKVFQKRGLKKVDDIAKLLLKHVAYKSCMEGRDVNAVAKDDAVEGFALTLKLNGTPHNCPGMDNIVCPDMSDVLQLLRQLKGLLTSVFN